jgi:hypothetical protein
MRTHLWTRVLCVLALAGMLVAFTGCGGDDSSGGGSSDYATGFKKAAEKYQNTTQTAFAKVQSGTTPAEKLGALDDVKQATSTAADDFAALDPPSNLKADNDELVTELRDFAGTFDQIKTAVQTKDSTKAASLLKQLTEQQTKIGQTLGRIGAKAKS